MGFERLVHQLLLEILTKLERMETNMAQDIVALDAAIKALGTLVTSEDNGIAAIIAAVNALIAKIQTNPTADFTTEVTALNAMAADLTTQTASIAASVAQAKGVTG